MTPTDRIARQVEGWLASTAQPRTPDYFADLLAQTGRVRQRPAWTFPERWLPMSVIALRRWLPRPLPIRVMALLAVLVLALIALVAILSVGSSRPLPAPYGLARNGFFVVAADGDLIALDPATGVRRVIVGGPTTDDHPVFSPDGTRIAFFRNSGDRTNLLVADDDGTDVVALDASDVDVSDRVEWSPDGRTILISAGSENTIPEHRSRPARPMAIVPADGRGEAQVLDVGMTVEMATWRPPLGREILFRGTLDGEYALYLVSPGDPSRPRRVSTPTPDAFSYDLGFGWSPNGHDVVFQRPVMLPQGMWVYVIDVDTGAESRLGTSQALRPAFSPDGTSVVVIGVNAENQWQPAVVDVATPGAQRWIGAPVDAGFTATWTPDGTAIVMSPNDDTRLWVLDPGGGQATQSDWVADRAPTYQRLALAE